MNRLTYKILFLLLITLICLKPGFSLTYKTKNLNLTIYQNGKAFITEVRQMNIRISKKPFEITFTDIPETIDPTSLQVSSTCPGFKLLDQSYEYNLINQNNLLNKYIGKKLTIVIPSFNKGKNRYTVRHAILISNDNRPIFMLDKQIYIGPYRAILLPSIPKGLHSKPVLVWLVKNSGPETEQDIKVSYIAGGLTWKAYYILKIAKDDKSAFLSGWFSITNNSGMTFNNARIRLVAGNIHWVSSRKRHGEKRLFLTAKRISEKYRVREKNIFEYHIYDIPRNITIKERQTKQISFVQSRSFPIKKILKVISKRAGMYRPSYINPVELKHPDVYIVFQNKKQDGLGIPLPKGIVRVYKDYADGIQFIGEDRIENIPEGSKILLNLGRAFDVSVEKKRTDVKKLRKDIYESEWEIIIKNAKNKTERVIVEEYVPGDWEFVENPAGFKKIASNWIKKTILVPAKAEKRIKYRVRCRF